MFAVTSLSGSRDLMPPISISGSRSAFMSCHVRAFHNKRKGILSENPPNNQKSVTNNLLISHFPPREQLLSPFWSRIVPFTGGRSRRQLLQLLRIIFFMPSRNPPVLAGPSRKPAEGVRIHQVPKPSPTQTDCA